MIIRNEKDRIRFIRELLSAKLPCEVLMVGKDQTEGMARQIEAMRDFIINNQYPYTPEPELGDHPSGMEAEEHW